MNLMTKLGLGAGQALAIGAAFLAHAKFGIPPTWAMGGLTVALAVLHKLGGGTAGDAALIAAPPAGTAFVSGFLG